jgi:hypothetical protein
MISGTSQINCTPYLSKRLRNIMKKSTMLMLCLLSSSFYSVLVQGIERVEVHGQRLDPVSTFNVDALRSEFDRLAHDASLRDSIRNRNLYEDNKAEKKCKSGYTKPQIYQAHLAAVSAVDTIVSQGAVAIIVDAAGLHHAIKSAGFPEKTAAMASSAFSIVTGASLKFSASATKTRLKQELNAALAGC